MSLCWMKRSGDIDARVPVTSTKYSINKMKLPVKTAWHPWFLSGEVSDLLLILFIMDISMSICI